MGFQVNNEGIHNDVLLSNAVKIIVPRAAYVKRTVIV